MNSFRSPSSSSGFTLMEMLVVMVIMGLLTVLLSQMLYQSLRLRERLLSFLDENRGQVLVYAWFRNNVAAATPGRSQTVASFRGDADQFQFLTLADLGASEGGLARNSWSLVRQNSAVRLMHTGQDGVAWQAASRAVKRGQFRYLDEQGQWFEAWPPAFSSQVNRLPRAVQVLWETESGTESWFVPVSGPRVPPKELSWAGT